MACPAANERRYFGRCAIDLLIGDNAQHAGISRGYDGGKTSACYFARRPWSGGFQRLQQQNDANVRLTAICHDLQGSA